VTGVQTCALPIGTVHVQSPRDELLARPALAGDEHGRLARGHLLDDAGCLLHQWMVADDVLDSERLVELLLELPVLRDEVQPFKGARDRDSSSSRSTGLAR